MEKGLNIHEKASIVKIGKWQTEFREKDWIRGVMLFWITRHSWQDDQFLKRLFICRNKALDEWFGLNDLRVSGPIILCWHDFLW